MHMDHLRAQVSSADRKFEVCFNTLQSEVGTLTNDQLRSMIANLANLHRQSLGAACLMLQVEQAEDNHPQPCPISIMGCPKCA